MSESSNSFYLHSVKMSLPGNFTSRSPLRQLADIISESVDKIDAIFAKDSLQYPVLDVPVDRASPSEAASMRPDIVAASMLIAGACAQLGATVNIPMMMLFNKCGGVRSFKVLCHSINICIDRPYCSSTSRHVYEPYWKATSSKYYVKIHKVCTPLRLLR